MLSPHLKHRVLRVFPSALLLFILAGGVARFPLALASPGDALIRAPGAAIVLTVMDPPLGAWTAVQWSNADQIVWHNVDNWVVPLALDEENKMFWGVDAKDFGTGPYRWVIYDKDPARGGKILGASQLFNFPNRENEWVWASVTIVRPLPLDWVTVPAGNFLMGSMGGPETYDLVKVYFGVTDDVPTHTVYLNAYQIGKYEVTNQQYARCVTSGLCRPALDTQGHPYRYTDPQYAQHPVVYVTWYDAVSFCAWSGGRLPTEAEWEKAARGTDRRTYPWGNQAPSATLANYDDMVGDTTEVGAYPAGASPYGALDMAGSVWEWTADWYSQNYYGRSPSNNPTGPRTGTIKAARGGAFFSWPTAIQTTYRAGGRLSDAAPGLGIRCAR
jgi:formylglycine-generating enzyme required for sulfatase activity